jgi:putative thioredoxin
MADMMIGGAKPAQPKGGAQREGRAGGPGAPPAGDPIKNSNTRGFMADVIDASHDTPVIVDFWAPWCGPCKQLGPLLEKAVREARGAVRMVKINIDESPEIAQQMRIQSIPVVYAFVQGRPVDGFVGAVPESQIKTFIKRLMQTAGAAMPDSPVEQALEEAKALMEAGDFANAGGILAQVVQHDPTNAIARARLARAQLAAKQHKQARDTLAAITADKMKDPAVAAEANAVKAALELAESAGAAGSMQELKAKVAADPNDHQARLDLASALYAAGDGEGAIDTLIDSIRRNRAWNEEAARKQLLKLFEALGPTDPRTVQGRRKLSSVLFS